MDLRKLKKLIDLVEESGIAELELTEGEEKVKICRHQQSTPQPVHTQYIQAQASNPAPTPTKTEVETIKTTEQKNDGSTARGDEMFAVMAERHAAQMMDNATMEVVGG